MPSHKSAKIRNLAIAYFLTNKSTYSEITTIFQISEKTFKRWFKQYKKNGTLTRKSMSFSNEEQKKIHKTGVNDDNKLMKLSIEYYVESKISEAEVSAIFQINKKTFRHHFREYWNNFKWCYPETNEICHNKYAHK